MEHNIHLVTFANKEPFIKSQKILDLTCKKCGISTHTMWNQEQIYLTEFYKKNKNLFDRYKTIGFGLFIWKPYIIYQRLISIENNEFIYYQDSSQYDFNGLEYNINQVCEFMNKNNIELIPGFTIDKINRNLIKEECLQYLNYHTNEDFLNKNHIHTSPMLLKKTPYTVNFIKEWMDLCQIPQCIIKNTRSHQCDQAILNILLDKYGYKGLVYIQEKSESKKYSVYWKMLLEYINDKDNFQI